MKKDTVNKNLHLFDEAAAYYDVDSFSYLAKQLIDISIIAMSSEEFQQPGSQDLSAVAGTLTLAKLLIPDEFAFRRMFEPKQVPPQ